MEPIQHKKLSITLIIGGILVATIGIILIFSSFRTAGVILLIIGAVLFLIGLPTMILLSAYSAKQEMEK